MSVNVKNRMPMVVGIVMMVVALVLMARSQPAQAQRGEAAGSGPHYTVIETQGFNLLVTDNASNKLYFYAADKDAPVGSAMKLRASLDLSQTGKEEIKPATHNLENIHRREEK